MKARTAATAAIGAAMLALAALSAPAWARPAVIPALGCLGLSLAPRPWPPAATLTASAAVLLTAAGPARIPPTAAEGILVLGYLLGADGIGEPVTALRHRWPLIAAAAATTGLVAAALLIPAAPALYLVLAGAAAIVLAYALALPARNRAGRR
jgi:hypothetical protein